MTYSEFEGKWLGGRVDIDGVYGYQCVDLAKQNMFECQGVPNGSYGNAIDYWTNTHPNILQKYTRVSSTDALMSDLIVLNPTSTNAYGHIGVSNGQVSPTQVVMLEQNGSTGNGSGTGPDAIRLRWVDRSRIAGLLRPITNQDGGSSMAIIQNNNDWRWRMNRLHWQLVYNADVSDDVFNAIIGQDAWAVTEQWSDHPDSNLLIDYQIEGEKAIKDNWEQQIFDLRAENAKLKEELANCQATYIPVSQLYIKEGDANVSSTSNNLISDIHHNIKRNVHTPKHHYRIRSY